MEAGLGRQPESADMARRWARRVERCCCSFATYLPLVFVYGITTWAMWVMAIIGSVSTKSRWLGKLSFFCTAHPSDCLMRPTW